MKRKHGRGDGWRAVLAALCCIALLGGAILLPGVRSVLAEEAPPAFSIASHVSYRMDGEAEIGFDAASIPEGFTLSSVTAPTGETLDAETLLYRVTENGVYAFTVCYLDPSGAEGTAEEAVAVDAITPAPAETPAEAPAETPAEEPPAEQPTEEKPADPVCTCGAQPDVNNITTHKTDCPLYKKPGTTIVKFLLSRPVALQAARGTSAQAVCGQLPKFLPAVDENGLAFEAPVTWNIPGPDAVSSLYEEDAYTYGSRYGYGPWTFTASADPAFSYGGEAMTAVVTIPDCMEIAGFCGAGSDGLLMKFPILPGESVDIESIRDVGAVMADGGYKSVPISWRGSCDSSRPGIYRYEILVDGRYTGMTSAYAEIIVSDCR
jgi:hypothetical protein